MVSKINVKKHTKRGTETRADILDTIGGSGGTGGKLLPSQKKSLAKVYKKINKREAKEGVSPREDWGWRGKKKVKRPDVLKLSKKSRPLKKTKSILSSQKKKKIIKRTSAAFTAGAASQWIDYKD